MNRIFGNHSAFFKEDDGFENRALQLNCIAAEQLKDELLDMEYLSIEKRLCKRFSIRGATASFIMNGKSEEFCKVINISRGGLKLLSKELLEINTELNLKISIPGEKVPLTLLGQVRWISLEERKFKYIIGVEFNPYGEQKGQNYPGNLVKIISLEKKFSTPYMSYSERYDIDH